MKWLKYICALLCILLAVGTLPSVFFIGKGLVVGQADEPIYFLGKLLAYIAIIVVLIVISMKLLRSAKGR